MKWFKRLGYVLGFLYLLLAGLLYFGQESLMLHPHPLPENHPYGEHAEEWIDLPDGNRLNALRLRVPNPRGVILYLHGNVGSNGRSLYQTRQLRELGYDLYLVDYRGFGKSTGTITTEAHLTEDLQYVYDRLATDYGEANVYLLGYSLGSGPASYLAANNQPAGMVLIAPYRSLTAMKNRWFWMFPDFLLKYELNNTANLARATVPVAIVHGTADELIPVEMGRSLATLASERITLYELPGVSHRGAIMHRKVKEAVRQLIK
ncbi:MAG: alpha/beta fold hydrolase [Bacteroidota bacterium]